MSTNRCIRLARRPVGLLGADDFAHDEVPLPELVDGEALMRTRYLSIDPTLRTWLSDARSYFPPVEIGEVVRCSGAGEIVETRCDAYEVGELVTSLPGWQEYAVVRDDIFTTKMPEGMDPKDALGLYGGNGLAAWVGMTDIGRPTEGDTVVVSGAAGSTGSIAGQLARIAGARAVGIAGTAEKCAWVVDDLGFDACINYRDDDVAGALRAATPDRVDVFFDNVGGWILDAVLGRLDLHARVVLCGAIAVYNEDRKPPGPANYLELITQRARMEGFNAFDNWGRLDECVAELRAHVDAGRLRYTETVVDGLDRAHEAVNLLFSGGNTGKLLVAV